MKLICRASFSDKNLENLTEIYHQTLLWLSFLPDFRRFLSLERLLGLYEELRVSHQNRQASGLRGLPAVKITCELVVLGLHLEVSLGMIAYGTHLGSLLADDDVTAVAALPDHVVVL